MLTFEDKKIEEALTCPICKSPFCVVRNGSGTLYCKGAKKHCYDFSSGGYVNFSSPGQSGGGDSKQAVKARRDFLELGYYEPIAIKLCDILKKYLPNEALVIDAGCGEGYYTNKIAASGFSTMGFDLSKFAADAAAKRAAKEKLNNAFFGVASVFSLPVINECADAVVNVFAPCAEEEYSRVLKSNGLLVVAAAGENHLLGLKKAIYNDVHKNDVRADMPEYMKCIDKVRLQYRIAAEGKENIKNLFAMTPYYWRTSKEDAEKLESKEMLETEIDVVFEVYQKV